MKQEEKTKQSIEQIINAAIPEFVTKGYEDAVLNDICRNNGISKGRLFHHFSGKDDLYIACCEYIARLFSTHNLRFTPKSNKTLQENLHDYFIYRNVFFLQKKGSIDILWTVTRNDISKFKHRISEIYEECRNTNISVLENICETSLFPPPNLDSRAIARIFYVAQSYTVMNCALGNTIYSFSEAKQKQLFNENVVIMDSVIDTLFFGLYPRDEKEPKRMKIDWERSEEMFERLQI
ncbi:MAG: TetR/AcrR family transcriptional regulator [Clostridia bacterium]|nr:TetR/AcrR family transcriptional regulator [Clostridia bacterium]